MSHISKEDAQKFNDKLKDIATRWISHNKQNNYGYSVIYATLYDNKILFRTTNSGTSGISSFWTSNEGYIDAKYIEDDSTLDVDAKKYFKDLEEQNKKIRESSVCKTCGYGMFNNLQTRMW